MSQINPYESPAPVNEPDPGDYMLAARRPVTPMIVGVISLVFGGFGILGIISGVVMMAIMPQVMLESSGQTSWGYMIAMWILGSITSVLMVAAGIGLVQYRGWGRKTFNIYAVLAILSGIFTIVMAAVQTYPQPAGNMPMGPEQMEVFQRVVGVVSGLVGMVFPVLGLVFVNRPKVVESLR